LFVFYLAWSLWKQWRAGTQLTGEGRLRGGLGQAVLMNFLSPGPYMFWSLVNGPLLLSALHQSAWHGAAFLFGFYGTFVGGMLGLAAIFHQARRFGPRLVRILLLASIGILVVFGGMLVYQGLTGP
jgi:threonine/homoserine/homoserine lactone efflux protein